MVVVQKKKNEHVATASPADIPQCKGNTIRSLLDIIKELKGEQVTKELFDVMSSDLRKNLEFNLVISNLWYPVEWLCELHTALDRVTGGGIALAEKIGYYSAMKDFTGIYQILFRLLRPETLLKKSARIFPTFFNQGVQEVFEAQKGFARCRWICPGFNSYLWADIHGTCRAALEVCGARNVKIKFVQGGRDRDVSSISEARWD